MQLICGHDGIGRHARFRCCHLGERFCSATYRDDSLVKTGLPVFIAADQALRSASASSPCKNQRKQNSGRESCRECFQA